MWTLIAFILAMGLPNSWASKGPSLALEGIETGELDSFYDPSVTYELFPGRVTDRDQIGNTVKVKSETKNIKFFRSGDPLNFKIGQNLETYPCKGNVRTVEEGHIVIYVIDLGECWEKNKLLRRGSLLYFKADILRRRIQEASKYRLVLLQRRKDYLNQLNDQNKFLWAYDDRKLQRLVDFDRQKVAIEKAKEKALSDFITKKKEASRLQLVLRRQLTEIDEDLQYYRINKDEFFEDRWFLDQDLGLPVGKRPQKKKLLPKDLEKRWNVSDFK